MKEYFSHDLKARNDRKMVRLMMEYGMEGIGIYWCIVEMLYEEEGRLMLSECDRIGFELRVERDKVIAVICETGLFEMDQNEFWSASVDRRIEAQIHASNSSKKAAETRWQKYRAQTVKEENATAIRPQSERNASKEKKSKEKESKEVSNILSVEEKKQNFWSEILDGKREIDYASEMLKDFFNYWSETNSKGKMRCELEKTFQINNRLATWYKNQKNWSAKNQPLKNSMQSVKDNLATALDKIYNSDL